MLPNGEMGAVVSGGPVEGMLQVPMIIMMMMMVMMIMMKMKTILMMMEGRLKGCYRL